MNPAFSLQSSRINSSDLPASGGPARRPPAVLRAGMAGGFEVNPQPLNPEPVNGYCAFYRVGGVQHPPVCNGELVNTLKLSFEELRNDGVKIGCKSFDFLQDSIGDRLVQFGNILECLGTEVNGIHQTRPSLFLTSSSMNLSFELREAFSLTSVSSLSSQP